MPPTTTPSPLQPQPSTPRTKRLTRRLFGVCAVAMAIGGPAQILDDLHLLLTRRSATARVLGIDEPGGAPESLRQDYAFGPSNAGMDRIGLRFTTAEGQAVTFAMTASYEFPWRLLRPNDEVAVLYDPSQPERRPVARSTRGVLLRMLGLIFGLWIVLPAMIRMARGAPELRRACWPPWPFRH